MIHGKHKSLLSISFWSRLLNSIAEDKSVKSLLSILQIEKITIFFVELLLTKSLHVLFLRSALSGQYGVDNLLGSLLPLNHMLYIMVWLLGAKASLQIAHVF